MANPITCAAGPCPRNTTTTCCNGCPTAATCDITCVHIGNPLCHHLTQERTRTVTWNDGDPLTLADKLKIALILAAATPLAVAISWIGLTLMLSLPIGH